MKLVKIEYLFDDEKKELEEGKWRHGLVVKHDKGDEIDKALDIMCDTEDVNQLNKVLQKCFGSNGNSVVDDDIAFYTDDLDSMEETFDIIVNSIEE